MKSVVQELVCLMSITIYLVSMIGAVISFLGFSPNRSFVRNILSAKVFQRIQWTEIEKARLNKYLEFKLFKVLGYRMREL